MWFLLACFNGACNMPTQAPDEVICRALAREMVWTANRTAIGGVRVRCVYIDKDGNAQDVK